MKHGYVRLSPRGATESEQREALVGEGVAPASVHVDDQRKVMRRASGSTKLPPLEVRPEAIRCCRRGDVLVVATAGRLGVGREDMRQVIAQVAERGASVQVAGGTPFGGAELAALIAFEAAAHLEVERERLAPARKARKAGGAQKLMLKIAHKRALLALWRDPGTHTPEAVVQAAKDLGYTVSRRSLYTHLGPRLIAEDLVDE